MAVVKAWPNLQFMGRLRDVPRNVFMKKLDHALDFSYDIMHRLDDMGLNVKRVNRVTKEVNGPNGLIVTDHYEMVFKSEEEAIVATLTLGEQVGSQTEKGW